MPMDIEEDILTPLQELRDNDITHDDLGTANGFHDAQLQKNKACDYVSRIAEMIQQFGDSLERGYLDDNLTKIKQQIAGLKGSADAINNLVTAGTNQTNYPKSRTSNLKQIETKVTTLQTQVYPFESALRLCRLESQLTAENALTKIETDAGAQLVAINKTNSDADTVLKALRDKLSKFSTDEAADNFSALAGNHKTRESNWFWAFIIASVVTVGCIIWAAVSFQTSPNLGVVIGEFLKRALVISTPAIFMKVCLGKYNLERNLRIIYNHRDTVLNQYRVFEASIGDDNVDAKNQFRLEIARVIFDDPETGYTKANSSNDININPVLSTIEKVAKTAG